MQFIIRSKEIEISQDLNSYIKKRISKLEKFLKGLDSNLIEVVVEIGKVSGRHRRGEIFQLGVNLRFTGKFFRAETRGESLYAMIDEAQEELEEEIIKYKTKQATMFKRGAISFKKSLGLSSMARFRNSRKKIARQRKNH